jgi:transcriptional regulator GlxA family with amidase domain
MHRIGLVLFGEFEIMSSAAIAVFEVANLTASKPFYDVRVLSEKGGAVRSSIGMIVETSPLAGAYDTLLVAASHAQGRGHLHRGLRSRRGGAPRRPPRDDALATCP